MQQAVEEPAADAVVLQLVFNPDEASSLH